MWQDMLGLSPSVPKFVRTYADLRTTMHDAVAQWGADVASGDYPAPEHAYA